MPNNGGRPVSRFWACVFAASIFALFWTPKLGKTRRWILLVVPLSVVPSVGPELAALAAESWGSPDYDLLVAVSTVAVFSWAPLHAAVVYLMFRWTTEYNLDNFGVRSKREWRQGGDGR